MTMRTKGEVQIEGLRRIQGQLTAPGNNIKVPFEIRTYVDHQLTISIPEVDNPGIITEVLLEINDGKLEVLVWGEHGMGEDPDARITVLEDATDRTWKV